MSRNLLFVLLLATGVALADDPANDLGAAQLQSWALLGKA